MEQETNVFIEFDIIKRSDRTELMKELDLLVAVGKRIYIWSKTIDPERMSDFCRKYEMPVPEKEKDEHKKVWDLRRKGKTYKEIADLANVQVEKIGFYARTDPSRQWVLDDWILGYHKKDSSIYPKVDVAVDSDKRLVNRFKRAGRSANYVEKL